MVVKVELPTQTADHPDFQKDQPEAASKKESRQFTLGLLAERKIGPRAGEQEEHWSAEMRDPAREE